MRISDWSSDVCSSDLAIEIVIGLRRSREPRFPAFFGGFASIKHGDAMRPIEIRAVSMPVFGGWQRPARHRFISDQEDFRVIRQRPAFLEIRDQFRSEEHTSELQSLMRISYAALCLKTNTT